MIMLSQRDPKWAGKTIGKSSRLIRDYGCTITSIAMLSDYFKCYHDPAWMAKHLDFTSDGLIYWNSINKKSELKFDFVYRYYRDKHGVAKLKQVIEDALKNPDTAVVIEIRKAHWVAGVRKSIYPWSKWYLTSDPWPLPSGAKNWYDLDMITGCAVFQKRK